MARTTKRQALQDVDLGPTDIHFYPRTYQLPAWDALTDGQKKRALLIWPRGVGKDLLSLWVIWYWMVKWPGQYFHVFTSYGQGKRGVWDASYEVQGKTVKYLDIFPPALVKSVSQTELQIELKPIPPHTVGSIYQIVGAENADAIRGTHPNGVILSEYRDMKESVWSEVVEPAIAARNGFAIFATTTRGKNHLWKLWKAVQGRPEWFVHRFDHTVPKYDAIGEKGGLIFTPEKMEELSIGKDPADVAQEYDCSFDGRMQGTIFGDALAQALQDGRVTRVPRETQFPVGCVLDIGRSDGTAIIFYQTLAREVRLLDYLAFRANAIKDLSAAHYAIKRIQEKPYLVTRIVLPNDAQITGYSASQSTEDVFREVYPDTVLLDKIPVQQGHEMGRALFSRLVFDEVKCRTDQENGMPSLLDSLGSYRYAWDDTKQEYGVTPVHDQYSHGADAFRYGAMEGFTPLDWGQHAAGNWAPPKVEIEFNPFAVAGRR